MMNALKKLSTLKLVLSPFHHISYKHILLNGKALCVIEDIKAFYQSLGYTIEMAKAGVLPDEFLWDEYITMAIQFVCRCLLLSTTGVFT